MKNWYAAAVAAAAVIVFSASEAAAQTAEPQNGQPAIVVNPELAKKGEKVYKAKMCNSCHSIGKGKVVGPDLKGVTERRTVDWLKVMIITPEVALLQDTIAQRLKAEHGNIAMPNMRVKPEEFEQLVHYLAAQTQK